MAVPEHLLGVPEFHSYRMKPSTRSVAISSPMTFLFSSEKRLMDCLTGLASGRTCRECSANSLGTPGRSLADHAKMLRFSRRKWMSSLSYFRSMPAPMRMTCSALSSS